MFVSIVGLLAKCAKGFKYFGAVLTNVLWKTISLLYLKE